VNEVDLRSKFGLNELLALMLQELDAVPFSKRLGFWVNVSRGRHKSRCSLRVGSVRVSAIG